LTGEAVGTYNFWNSGLKELICFWLTSLRSGSEYTVMVQNPKAALFTPGILSAGHRAEGGEKD
jgi:hypothetical protein